MFNIVNFSHSWVSLGTRVMAAIGATEGPTHVDFTLLLFYPGHFFLPLLTTTFFVVSNDVTLKIILILPQQLSLS